MILKYLPCSYCKNAVDGVASANKYISICRKISMGRGIDKCGIIIACCLRCTGKIRKQPDHDCGKVMAVREQDAAINILLINRNGEAEYIALQRHGANTSASDIALELNYWSLAPTEKQDYGIEDILSEIAAMQV